jgi:hypothetical protein
MAQVLWPSVLHGAACIKLTVSTFAVKGGGGVYPGIDAILSCDKGYGYKHGDSVTIICGTDGKYASTSKCEEVSQRALKCQIGIVTYVSLPKHHTCTHMNMCIYTRGHTAQYHDRSHCGCIQAHAWMLYWVLALSLCCSGSGVCVSNVLLPSPVPPLHALVTLACIHAAMHGSPLSPTL